MESTGFSAFTIDAVARRAGVARMTVYYQFESKLGLLEGVFDDLATRGQMNELPHAFAQRDALDALAGFVAAFGRFWSTDRLLQRRLTALGVLDPELEQSLNARRQGRRQGARVIVERLIAQYGHRAPDELSEAADVLYTLTSFETFDTLAGEDRSPEDVIPPVQRLVSAALGLGDR
jgi:AcrR family transcriptional regulator